MAPEDGDPITRLFKATSAYFAGMANAVGSNSLLGAGRQDPSAFGEYASYAQAGQRTGDVLSVVQGGAEMVIGAGGTFVATGSGVGVVVTPGTVAVGLHGAVTTSTALSNLMNPTKVEARSDNKRKLDQSASGDHSVFNDRGNSTYKKNDKNPTGFDEVKRVDTEGKAHRNPDGTSVPTPHVKEKGQKGVTPAQKGKDY